MKFRSEILEVRNEAPAKFRRDDLVTSALEMS
jgi:hypothetical protein